MNLQNSLVRYIENQLKNNHGGDCSKVGVRLAFPAIVFYNEEPINKALIALDKILMLESTGIDKMDDAHKLLLNLLIDAANIELKDIPASLKRFEEWEAKQKLEEQK
jgi:hypothetical protein